MPDPLRILVVDDHPLMRSAVRRAIEASEQPTEVAEADDASSVRRQIDAFAPGVVIMDLQLSPHAHVSAACELIRDVLERLPATQVVVLSAYLREGFAWRVKEAGARAYLDKSATDAELRTAIDRVTSGRTDFWVLPDKPLTDREIDVLALVAEGRRDRAIAAALYISAKTVGHHWASVKQKLAVDTRVEAVEHARRLGWLDF